MSRSGMSMDAEEFGRLAEIGQMFEEIERIAEESEMINVGPGPVTPDDLPGEISEQPLGELTPAAAAELDGTDPETIPEEIRDVPLSDLTIDQISRSVGSLDLGGAGQTFVACGSSGCAIYDNG